MADDRQGRDKQAQDTEKRQRQRYLSEELERRDETEPEIDPATVDEFEGELDEIEFPVTASELVEEIGGREIETPAERYTVAELLPETDAEIFEEPAEVRVLVQRPTIAAAMKRVIEASETLPNTELGRSQREAYEKTFRELKAIDADDDDEGIRVIADWIIDQIREKEKIPGSRGVRREAAKFCRKNGYSVRNDEWLGV
ncbi:MAG: hypothetical protein V5A52_06940 [Halovenus sp.]|uniref:DUF5789 family protein n=1 Tax=Halovenus amylolytica TaxID=2500550 RepID=UPI000FE3764D